MRSLFANCMSNTRPLPSQCCHPDLVREVFGLLVALGFDVAAFTPAPYQRVRLTRP